MAFHGMDNKQMDKIMSKKVSKIMHEGIRGRKVSQKQAVAVAFSMARKGKGRIKNKKLKKNGKKK